MWILDRVGKYIFWGIVFLVLTGGFVFRGEGFRFELSQINAFGVALGLVLLLRRRLFLPVEAGSVESAIWRVYRWGERNPLKRLNLAALIVGIVAFGTHLIRHLTFDTTFFDMSFLNTALFFPFGDPLFHCSVCRNGTQFAEHILFSLVPLAAILQFLQSDVLVFLLKTVFLISPIYLLIRFGPLQERRETWFWVFVLILMSHPLKSNFPWDFREDHFGFFLILLTGLALYKRQVLVAGLLMVATAATKENLPFSTALWIVPLLFAPEIKIEKSKRWVLGGFVFVFSLVYLYMVNKVFIPHFMSGGESQNNILLRFPGLGSTMDEAISNVLARPFEFVLMFASRMDFWDCLKYVIVLLLPFLIGFRSWTWAVPALPQLAANLLVDHDQQRMMVNHYEVLILAFLILATVFSIGTLHREKKVKWILCALLLALCVSGRGPLGEWSKRLFYDGYKIPAAIQMASWEKLVVPPLAADAFTVTHFHRVRDLRILELAQHSIPDGESDRKAQFVEMNPSKGQFDQAKDSADAKTFIVNLNLLGGPWFLELLKSQGGQELARAQDARGKDFAVLVRVEKSPLEVLCAKEGLCQKAWGSKR